MVNGLMKYLYASIYLMLVVQLAGCGAIMYDEYRGQRAGRIDPDDELP